VAILKLKTLPKHNMSEDFIRIIPKV